MPKKEKQWNNTHSIWKRMEYYIRILKPAKLAFNVPGILVPFGILTIIVVNKKTFFKRQDVHLR